MAGQQQRRSGTPQTEETSDEATTDDGDQATEGDDDLDALLDEIDEVLEENPEDFVRNYVQKGGQ